MKKIHIKGVIVPNDVKWIYELFDIEAVSPKDITRQLEEANNDELEVIINSGGGSVYDASEIYTSLRDYGGRVTGKIVGIAASAASVIAMASDKLLMSPTGQMMIHNASNWTEGDYREMDRNSQFLKNVNQTIANAYNLKSGKSYEELLAMMDDETWLTAQQALEHKLIDEIMFESKPSLVASAGDFQMLPQKVIDKVRNEFGSKKGKGYKEEKNMTLEELKNNHPELYNQVRNEGYEKGVKDENARIKSVEDNALPGFEGLVNKAKYDEPINGDQLAGQIIRAQKEQGNNYLNNRNQDADDLNEVEGSDGADNSKTEEEEIKETANTIAGFINKKRGGIE